MLTCMLSKSSSSSSEKLLLFLAVSPQNGQFIPFVFFS